MGMYCTILDQNVKLMGLLQKAVHELAVEHMEDSKFSGVDLAIHEDGEVFLGGTASLSYAEVLEVVHRMRHHLLNGHALTCSAWSASYGKPEPLTHLQDIWRFEDDVSLFALLARWLGETDGSEELFFA